MMEGTTAEYLKGWSRGWHSSNVAKNNADIEAEFGEEVDEFTKETLKFLAEKAKQLLEGKEDVWVEFTKVTPFRLRVDFGEGSFVLGQTGTYRIKGKDLLEIWKGVSDLPPLGSFFRDKEARQSVGDFIEELAEQDFS